ncbi:MAG: diguanylate cyclase [Rhodospirillales bacterium]|nr:diguanylate cyclase [Rhodospirillales bacterium]
MAEIREVQAYGRIAAYGTPGDGQPGSQTGRQPESKAGAGPKPREPRQIRDTARVLGIPVAEYTPRVQEALTLILGEIDKLRWELEICHKHQTHILDLADAHAYLPVLNRRAFERELSRASAQVDRTGDEAWLLTVIAGGIEAVRRNAGLGAVEFVEKKLADLIKGELSGATPIGALGSAEFGIVLGASDRKHAEDAGTRIAGRARETVFEYAGESLAVSAHWGIAAIAATSAPGQVHQAADADLRARAGPSTGPSTGT